MLRALGICIAVSVGLMITVNAALMLASPQLWFHLPVWLRAQGSLTEKKYASGWGAVQIRIAGGLILSAIVWVLYDMLLKAR